MALSRSIGLNLGKINHLKIKVPAATLTETLISMVIILAVFTIAITIYTRITFSGFSMTKSKVESQIKALITNLEISKDFEDQTLELDSVKYTKKVEPYKEFTDLYLITVEAEQNGPNYAKGMKIIEK